MKVITQLERAENPPGMVIVKCPACKRYLLGNEKELSPAYVADYKFFCPVCNDIRHIYKKGVYIGNF